MLNAVQEIEIWHVRVSLVYARLAIFFRFYEKTLLRILIRFTMLNDDGVHSINHCLGVLRLIEVRDHFLVAFLDYRSAVKGGILALGR